MFAQPTQKRANCLVAAAIVLTLGGRLFGLRKGCV